MVTRSPEGGDKPSNPGLSDFKVLPEQKGVGLRVQKLEEPRQQRSQPEGETSRRTNPEPNPPSVRETRRRAQRRIPRDPSEQRGEGEPFQPNPAEQQAAERLGKPPPIPEAEQDTVQRFAEVQEKLKRFPEDEQKEITRVWFHWTLERYRDDIGFHQHGRIMEMIELLNKIVEIYSRDQSDVERVTKQPPSDPPDHEPSAK
jgi:hypothetical protein